MKTVRNETDRANLIERIGRLDGGSKPAWGRMSIDQMISHLVQAGELPFAETLPDKSTFVNRTIIKPLILYVMPMPKEVKISAEMDQKVKERTPGEFEADRRLLVESISRLGTLAVDHKCVYHPMFGKMSAKEWGLIVHKHIDHHLKQFGV